MDCDFPVSATRPCKYREMQKIPCSYDDITYKYSRERPWQVCKAVLLLNRTLRSLNKRISLRETSRAGKFFMGNFESTRSHALRAENELLNWGVDWWESWKSRHSGAAYAEADSENSSRAVEFRSYDVNLDPDGHEFIHTVRFAKKHSGPGETAKMKTPLVLMHGYGSGIGIYSTALPQLAEKWPGDVYAIDSRGSGLSSRHKWKGGYGGDANVQETEAYFIDAVEVRSHIDPTPTQLTLRSLHETRDFFFF